MRLYLIILFYCTLPFKGFFSIGVCNTAPPLIIAGGGSTTSINSNTLHYIIAKDSTTHPTLMVVLDHRISSNICNNGHIDGSAHGRGPKGPNEWTLQ